MDLNQVLNRLASVAAKALATEAAAVLLIDEEDRLIVRGAYGVPWLSGALEAVALPSGFAAVLRVDLGPKDAPAGALQVYDRQRREFTEAEVECLRAIADLGAVAIEAVRRASELETIEASKSQFVHVATHELRSPVAVAQSLVRTVLKGYAGPLTDVQQDVFARVSGRLDFLESLVNDLLDLAASRAPTLMEEDGPVALNASVGRTVLLLQPRAEEKGVALRHRAAGEELAVWANESGLDRIFVNLVDNAIKYTPAGGSVSVSMGREGDHVWVAVADSGIGIPADALPHLFDEFYRAPNAKAFAVGTGLGLAIVKDLVHQFGGEIEVESEAGKGTTFRVTFPGYNPR
jgi:signal transduction histidine kinase